ncbi:SDR family oxidoreductase [Tamlana sp. 2_MG-2023]|uniref:SDR family NAD(P)-dependent oxidoreductase n=1 Tax=unclassified Tamlana TaxID=2614803 RepID=UPI0026E21755|nr:MULTISPECIES: SDR family oxidoreductase [unclassified Tamlana]MDO6760198.1 SDR family oxidoreductase [Tamlana sp. 2_MG-2023]MDO6790104.1 SDR family oxidoreductase [Tamlana sp. 1_MG-2023]
MKTALVTGAASGLGYELAILLAKDQYKLILVDVNPETLAKAKASLLKDFDVEVITLVKDLGVPNVSNEIMSDLGNQPIDVLINNAGFGLFGTFAETDWERESAMLHVHILTATHLTKLVLKGMVERGSGKILNMSSLAAFQPGPLMSIYYASKGYMLSFSEAIANELKGTGVTVTAVCPGPTQTSFQKTVSENTKDNKIKFNMGTASEVAAYGYKAMLQGKSYAIPGTFNKFLAILPRFLPRRTASHIVRTIQQKNRED